MEETTRLRVAGNTFEHKGAIAAIELDGGIRAFRWNGIDWAGDIPDDQIDGLFEEVEERTDGECVCEFDE